MIPSIGDIFFTLKRKTINLLNVIQLLKYKINYKHKSKVEIKYPYGRADQDLIRITL